MALATHNRGRMKSTLKPVKSGTSRTIVFSFCTIYRPTTITMNQKGLTVLCMSSSRSASVSLIILTISSLWRNGSILRKWRTQGQLVISQLGMTPCLFNPTAPAIGLRVDLPRILRKELMEIDLWPSIWNKRVSNKQKVEKSRVLKVRLA